MERLLLSDDLLTGIQDIDNQHRELFEWGNRVIFADTNVVAPDDLKRAVDFLVRYVHRHFEAEEFAMKLFSYGGLEKHQKQHVYFRRLILDIQKRASEQGFTDAIRIKLHRMLSEWITHHIRSEDGSLARFLTENDADDSAPDLPTVDDLRSAGAEWLTADDVELKGRLDGEISQAELNIRLKN